jgi:uncharacterized protein (DUF697 family)
MTRKQLPKAITRPVDNVHAFSSSIVTDEVAPEPEPRPAAVFNKIEAEPPLAVSSAPIANDMAAEPDARLDALPPPLAAKRRALARRIVERHRTYAAVGGLVPVPVANIASVTAINLRMVQQLSTLYQVPFQRDRARAAIVSLIGGAAPSGFGMATSSALMWIIPGGLFVGLGVSALSAGALTRAIGQVFAESFENGAQLRG